MESKQEEYYNKYYNQGKTELDKRLADQQQRDQQQIATIGQAIDQNAQTASGQYQQRIDAAPTQERTQLDYNALDELVQRKQLQESMANAGLTDSGLNRTQQTSLSLQRGNADAATRRQTQDYVQAAQNAIDQIMADAQSQKTQQALNIQNNTDSWYRSSLASLADSSRTAAATQYAADQEYEAAVKKAALELETEKIKAAATQSSSNNKQMVDYATSLIKNNGYNEGDAWAAAYARFGTGKDEENKYYTAYNDAINMGYDSADAAIYANAGGGNAGMIALINDAFEKSYAMLDRIDTDVSGWKTFWSTTKGDGEKVAEEMAKRLGKLSQFAGMSSLAQEAVLANAFAMAVIDTWSGDAKNNPDKNKERLKSACESANVSYETALNRYNKILADRKEGQKKTQTNSSSSQTNSSTTQTISFSPYTSRSNPFQ